MIKKKNIDNRMYNIPPLNTATKRFDKTISFRVESDLIYELEKLLNMRYGGRKIPLNSISFVLRNAIKKKIRELKGCK